MMKRKPWLQFVPGSARVSRAASGVSPGAVSIFDSDETPESARETRALPQTSAYFTQ